MIKDESGSFDDSKVNFWCPPEAKAAERFRGTI